MVPPGETWNSSHVLVDGAYLVFDAGPADSVNLVIYSDALGLPGVPVATHDGSIPVAGLDNGDFVLEIVPPLALAPVRYRVSVQAVTPFFFQGLWFWHVRHQSTELERAFRNPDDFFETGCEGWDQASDCGLLVGLGKPDHCFALLGEIVEKCADLAIERTASVTRIPVGERFTYFLAVSNRGPADAVDVELVDAIPDELAIESVRRASIPLFPAWASATFEIEVEARTTGAEVVNVAAVTSATADRDPESDEDDATTRIHSLSDPSVPALSELGLALLALPHCATMFRLSRRG